MAPGSASPWRLRSTPATLQLWPTNLRKLKLATGLMRLLQRRMDRAKLLISLGTERSFDGSIRDRDLTVSEALAVQYSLPRLSPRQRITLD